MLTGFAAARKNRRARSASPSISVSCRAAACSAAFDAAQQRITGVWIQRRDAGHREAIDADLVVDATGRGGRVPAWLTAHGYEPPRQEQLPINLRYATRHLRLPAGALGDVKVVANGIRQSFSDVNRVPVAGTTDYWSGLVRLQVAF